MLVVKTFISDKHLLLVYIGQMGWGEWKKWREDGSLECYYPLSPMRPNSVSSEQQEVGIGKTCSMQMQIKYVKISGLEIPRKDTEVIMIVVTVEYTCERHRKCEMGQA